MKTMTTGDFIKEAQEQMSRMYASIEWERQNREPSAYEVKAKDVRGTVTEYPLRGRGYDVPDSLSEAIAWLSGYLDAVPEDCRDTAKIEVESESDYDSHVCVVTIRYERPETDEEWAARKADVERRAAFHAERRAAAEREEYERLRAKFDPS